MTSKVGRLFADIFETVGDVTLAKALIEEGDIQHGSIRLKRALSHLRKIADDFPSAYEAAVLAHLKRSQIQ